nr:cysteine-rich receptor-like protein kinase 25 [Ipomoea batatas]
MHPPMLLRFMLFTLIMGAVSQYNYRNSCPNTSTSAPTTTFVENRDFVLSNLSSKGNIKNGFYNYTAGSGPDTVYGMFMCQGDVSTGDCASCVNQASSDILRACSKQKAAIIWFDHCMLRFSDEYIFQRLDNKSAPLNMSSIEKDPRPGSMKRVEQTLEGMISKQSGKRFVTHESPIISGSKRVYSLGQCTPDLSESDCHTCLKNAVQILHTCCASALGARVLSPSCYVRYELYLFYNPEGSRNSSTKVIVAFVVPVIGIIFIIILVLYIVRNRNVKKGNITTNTTDVIRVATEESPEYDFANIQAITNDFSIENQIGKGGYGSVYKGMFPNGQEVAIKRLSRGSVQGAQEFKNEVEVVAKLQHKNLVRLLGFCSEEEEKILIYEFVANKSLDYFLFDNANERPTMTKVMLMLNSYFANSWSTPGEPAFYRSESKRIPKEIELALSITVNEVSISELYPR